MQAIYISHGGGPLPILGDPSHHAMNEFMKHLPKKLIRPKAIIVFSAHWEEDVVTIQGTDSPEMVYDYYGFPKESYEITYPAKGSPSLAKRVAGLLADRDIQCRIDDRRGYDHGVFIPLKMMYPRNDIPVIQVSLLHDLSPENHILLGKAMHGLKDENILVIGSGFSFHNLRAYDFSVKGAQDENNDGFQNWLIETITGKMTQEEREERISHWNRVPYARYCHPREEHLLPLHVCVGLAGEPGEVIFDDYIAGKRAVAFMWK